MFLLELNKLLELLLLELVTDEFNVGAEVADLGDLLLFGLRELVVDCVDVFFHFFLGLEKRLAILLFFSNIIDRKISWVRLGIKIALIEALSSMRGDSTSLQRCQLTMLASLRASQ